MKIIIAICLLLLTSCATNFSKPSTCKEQIAALTDAEKAAQSKSDETMAASGKNPESSDMAMAAAQAAIELAAASMELSNAKQSCTSNAE